jgi:hypothetical protein
MGIIGYNISLAVSVSILTTDKIQTVRVMYFKFLWCFFINYLPASVSCRSAITARALSTCKLNIVYAEPLAECKIKKLIICLFAA